MVTESVEADRGEVGNKEDDSKTIRPLLTNYSFYISPLTTVSQLIRYDDVTVYSPPRLRISFMKEHRLRHIAVWMWHYENLHLLWQEQTATD
jgi:hypothetical protein